MAKTVVELPKGLQEILKTGDVKDIAKYFVSKDHLKNILRLLPEPLVSSLTIKLPALEKEIQKRLVMEQIAEAWKAKNVQQQIFAIPIPGLELLENEDWKKLLPLFSYAQQKAIIEVNGLEEELRKSVV